MKKAVVSSILVAVVVLAVGVIAEAQHQGKIFRIGFLDPSTASGMSVLADAFRQELNKVGWIEGKNINIEYRFAEQELDRVQGLAADLVRQKVDLIVVSGTPAAAKWTRFSKAQSQPTYQSSNRRSSSW
jgi:putative tryptophan/tyrosine transport system substrate-binding protein